MDNWEDWLWESVSWDEYVPRWKAVKQMVELGLVPQFAQKGYVFMCPPKKLTERILTGLYTSRGKHSADIPWLFGRDRGKDGTEEEKAHYHHVLDAEFWEAFWNEWAHWSDVDPTTERGTHRQIDIQEYCWTQIDLVYSAQAIVLDELLHGADEDEYGGGGSRAATAARLDDVYLREAAESNQWGGYRR